MSTGSPSAAYRPDIDGLRALAILPVLAFHAFPSLMPGGFVGVDLFFVISGYLISLIVFREMQQGEFSFLAFYGRRVRRILPALIAVLAVCFMLGWVLLLPDELRALGKHMAASGAFMQNLVLQREYAGYFDVASEYKPLLHIWSLSVEEQFYLFFPLCAWVVWRLARQHLERVIWLGMLLSFGWAVWGERESGRLFFLATSRAWELLAGSLLACYTVFPRGLSPGGRGRSFMSFLGLSFLIAGWVVADAGLRWPGWGTLLPVGGAVALIAAGRDAPVNRLVLAHPALVWVGLLSYPLYLWHWPLLSFLRIAQGDSASVSLRLMVLLLSLLLAWATYRWIERPIRFHARGRQAKTMGLLILLAGVFALGSASYLANGFPGRWSAASGLVDAAWFDEAAKPWRPEKQDDDCRRSLGAEVSEKYQGLIYCQKRELANASGHWVLLGDSHAVSLYGGLADALAERGISLSLYGGEGTPPLRGVGAKLAGHDWDVLREKKQLADAMLRVAGNADAQVVVLVGFWRWYYGLKDDPSEPSGTAAIRYFAEPALPSGKEIVPRALGETIESLLLAGRQVVLVLDNPSFEIHPKECLGVRYFSPATDPRCEMSEAHFLAGDKAYRAAFQALASRYPAVKLVDGARPFCEGGVCRMRRDGRMLYYDAGHVSPAGARLIAREIMESGY